MVIAAPSTPLVVCQITVGDEFGCGVEHRRYDPSALAEPWCPVLCRHRAVVTVAEIYKVPGSGRVRAGANAIG